MTLPDSPRTPVRPRRQTYFLDEASRQLVETAVATAFAVPSAELRTASRGRAPVAFARQVAIYLAHVALGLSYSAVARSFRRNRTTVARACQVIEDRRDDPRVDFLLSVLERILGGLAQRVRA